MDHRFSAAVMTLIAASAALVALTYFDGQASHAQGEPERVARAANEHRSMPAAPADSISPSERAASEASNGIDLMRRVVASVGQYQSVSARVRHRTELFGQRIVGQGHYLQRTSERGLQVSYLLTVKTNERLVSLLQVCDGRYLWTRQNAEGLLKITRVDLPRLRRAGEGHPHDAMPVLLGGGLPSLLANLQTNFVVSPPQEVTLQGIPMWALAFRWNPQRVRLLSNGKQVTDDQGRFELEELPEQLPDRVFLLVGQDDLFPYHLDFRRSNASGGVSDSSPTRSLVTLEFYEVQFDVPIEPSRFVFKATGLKFTDETDAHIARLRSQIQR